jgi:flagellar hook-basal body complex protein FliE
MTVSGIEAIGAALPAMPAMPTTGATDAAGMAGDLTGTASSAAAGAVSGATDTTAASGAQSANGVEFGNLLSDGIDRLQGLQNTSDNLSVQAATGDATAIHDYTIAAAEASTATQLAVSLRNTGLQAFNSIMNMQL